MRFGNDLDPLRVQDGRDTESGELELVAHDRFSVVARLPNVDDVGQRIRHGGSLPDPATWPYYRRRGDPTVRVQKLQPGD